MIYPVLEGEGLIFRLSPFRARVKKQKNQIKLICQSRHNPEFRLKIDNLEE